MEPRALVLAHSDFDPYSLELEGENPLMEAGDWIRVIDTIAENPFPNHLLSPGAHLNLGFAHHKLGREKETGWSKWPPPR